VSPLTREVAKYVSLCALVGAVLLGLFHLHNRDLLLLTTDSPTLCVYVGFMIVALTAVVCVVFSPYWLVSVERRRIATSLLINVLTAATLLVIFQTIVSLALLWSDLMEVYRAILGPSTRLLIKIFTIQYLEYIDIVILIGLAWATRNAHDMHRRVGILGGGILGVAVFSLVAGWLVLPGGISNRSAGPPRHVVLVVLDGFGADVMAQVRSRNDPFAAMPPDASLTATTALPYTWGFFGVLYSGGLDCDPRRPSLLRRLQQRGVVTRWMSFHRNGFADTTRCPQSDYRGLRSYALNHALAAVPRLLGLDYNIGIGQDDPAAPQTVDRVLIPELKELFGRSERAFAVIHMRSSPDSLAAFDELKADGRRQRFAALLRAQDYNYPPQLESDARMEKARFVHGAALVLKNTAHLIEAMSSDPLLKNTTIIVTADHGTVFGGGHMYYGFHVDRAVLNIPVLIFGSGGALPPAPNRMLYSADLPATIAQLFGIDGTDYFGRPMLSPNAGHGEVATLALRSDRTKRYLLSITRAGARTGVFNLYPSGDGRMVRLGPGWLYVSDLTQEPTPAEVADVRSWLKNFAVPSADVQKHYR